MLNYFKTSEYFLDQVSFHHDGSYYKGNGIITWDPAKGFHIAVRVKRSKPYPAHKHIGAISFGSGTSLRMKLENGLLAITPRILIDDMALDFGGSMLRDLNRATFIQPFDNPSTGSSWSGSAIIETHSNLILPDRVRNETKIGDWTPAQSFSSSGLHYEETSGQRVIAQLNDKKYLNVDWSLPKLYWKKAEAWRFADGLQDALSIVSGQVTQLRYRTTYRTGRIITEMRAGYKTARLGMILRPLDHDILDKDIILQFANFFARNGEHSNICRLMFQQMADAAEQRTQQASELLIATILEAVIRSIYNHPFADKGLRKDDFSLEGNIMRFCNDYLSDDIQIRREWRKAIKEILEARKRLRDRNAHPDWLSESAGALSQPKLEQSTNDLIRLTRFYGYIMLALAGIRNLHPVFPAEITNWNPLFTITRIGDRDKNHK